MKENLFENSLQVLRDVAFMVPDLLNIVIPFLELRRQANKKRFSYISQLFNKNETFLAVFSIMVLWFILLSLP